MFLTSRSGLGKDKELLSLRRRFRYGLLLLIGGALVALIIAFSLLADRSGTLLVQADNPKGLVVLNGAVTSASVGVPLKKLRPDTYQVSVYLEGFVSNPATRLVPVESGKIAEVSFSLEPAPPKLEPEKPSSTRTNVTPQASSSDKRPAGQQTEKPATQPKSTQSDQTAFGQDDKPKFGTLKVATVPVEGGIWLDDTFMGRGKITLTDIPLGEFVIRFGEVNGYRTPESQKAFLNTSWPYANIEGVYLPLVYISAYLDRNGREITQKCGIIPGYVLGDAEDTSDPIAGPVVKYVEETGFFAWEIGYAQSNRNPPGEDFIEMVFDLPENFAGNKPL
ncbi:hypothetical protein KKA08_04715 [bacterium]|nr:hypothetical protein [bacterium]